MNSSQLIFKQNQTVNFSKTKQTALQKLLIGHNLNTTFYLNLKNIYTYQNNLNKIKNLRLLNYESNCSSPQMRVFCFKVKITHF